MGKLSLDWLGAYWMRIYGSAGMSHGPAVDVQVHRYDGEGRWGRPGAPRLIGLVEPHENE